MLDSILMTLLLFGLALNHTKEHIKLNEEERERYGKSHRNIGIGLWAIALIGLFQYLTER